MTALLCAKPEQRQPTSDSLITNDVTRSSDNIIARKDKAPFRP